MSIVRDVGTLVPPVQTLSLPMKQVLSKAVASARESSCPVRVVIDRLNAETAPYGIEDERNPPVGETICVVEPDGYIH